MKGGRKKTTKTNKSFPFFFFHFFKCNPNALSASDSKLSERYTYDKWLTREKRKKKKNKKKLTRPQYYRQIRSMSTHSSQWNVVRNCLILTYLYSHNHTKSWPNFGNAFWFYFRFHFVSILFFFINFWYLLS